MVKTIYDKVYRNRIAAVAKVRQQLNSHEMALYVSWRMIWHEVGEPVSDQVIEDTR